MQYFFFHPFLLYLLIASGNNIDCIVSQILNKKKLLITKKKYDHIITTLPLH